MIVRRAVLAAVLAGGALLATAPAALADMTVYVYTDDPSQVPALCAEAQAEWGPADHCRVLPARYENTTIGEAAALARGDIG